MFCQIAQRKFKSAKSMQALQDMFVIIHCNDSCHVNLQSEQEEIEDEKEQRRPFGEFG